MKLLSIFSQPKNNRSLMCMIFGCRKTYKKRTEIGHIEVCRRCKRVVNSVRYVSDDYETPSIRTFTP